MAGLGEVALDQMVAVFGVEPTQGRIDSDGQLPTGGASQSPKKCDRKDLFFASGEPMFGQ